MDLQQNRPLRHRQTGHAGTGIAAKAEPAPTPAPVPVLQPKDPNRQDWETRCGLGPTTGGQWIIWTTVEMKATRDSAELQDELATRAAN